MILAAGQGAILLAPAHSSSAAAHLILLFRNGRQAKLQGFIVFLSKQFEPCQLVSCLMRIERRTFAAPPHFIEPSFATSIKEVPPSPADGW